ncbi:MULTISPECIES: M56 family metallopeptidase [unclassified Bradyrhizobium]|uniref:M56 family metallopeptidase n=1 Tax=unclassified Bradyrhizobium TaxID=2631580 RepID=UPI002FF1DE41
MLAWMSYVIVVSLLLSLAALALEHSARFRQKPTRWLWGTSMITSLLVPLVVSSVSLQIPRLTGVVDPVIPQRVVAVRDITISGLSPSGWLTATAGSLSASPGLDRLLQVGWSAASAILFLAILASSMQLNRRRRHWERGNVAGVPVHISEDAGPAIVGLLDPHIVVPRWLLQCSPDVQELVIAHERSHLEAHDARLVTIALGLLVCMPWNLPLWWQLRRLRFAIEIDCDARVLRCGYDISRYGETLIAIGERQSATIAMVAAMSEPRSLLEQRIRNMLREKTKYTPATAVVLGCLGIAFAVGAAEISPPDNDGSGKSASQEIATDSRIRDGHVGFYQLNDNAMLTITRNGQQLNARLTGQPSVPIFARSDTEFSYKDKSISFITEPDGQTTSLILHQHGINMPMKRIDAATAQRIASTKAEQRYRPKPDRVGALIILR